MRRAKGQGGDHQVIDAFAVDGADREDPVEAELGEFQGAGLGAAGVDLVDRNEDRFAAAAEPLGDLAVQRHDAFLHVDHKHNDIRRLDRQAHLLDGGLDDGFAGFLAAEQSNASGVHQRERAALPLGLGADAVAGDPRLDRGRWRCAGPQCG